MKPERGINELFVEWAISQIESDIAFKREFLHDICLVPDKMPDIINRLIISDWVPNFMIEFDIPAMILDDDSQCLARLLLQTAMIHFADELEIIREAGYLN
jgi:hypothetical protein